MTTELPIADHPDARTDLEGWAAYAKEKIDGRPVIVSVSGGKDSLAVGLLLKSAGIPFSCVTMDTGWEADSHGDYMAYLETLLGPIKVLTSDVGGMEEWCLKKGMFPSRMARWCTEKLKLLPFKAHLDTLDDESVNAIGVRASESKARAALPEWEDQKGLDCEVWRPLIRWSTQDVIDQHRRHGAKPNPLYAQGATRVGCYPCVFARKSEVRMIADLHPSRIDRLERLEAQVTKIAQARGGAHADKSWGFFQSRKKDSGGKYPLLPIREVVDWSRTERGGKQLGLFQPDYEREGCMRWGLCDTGGDGA